MTGKNAFQTSLGVMVIIMSIILFFYVNAQLIFKKEKRKEPIIKVENINTLDDCEAATKEYLHIDTFSASLRAVISQISRLRKKKNTIKDILLQKFTDTEMSYGRFQGTVDGIEKVMCVNIKSILNRIGAFDEEEYSHIKKEKERMANKTGGIIQSKLAIYNEYIEYVEKAVEKNEEILLKLDRLLAEISKFNSLSDKEVEDMDAMKEIEALINDTKWYRQ